MSTYHGLTPPRNTSPDLSVHPSRDRLLLTRDLLRGLLEGRRYILDGQTIAAAESEKAILKTAGWACRAKEVPQ